MLKIKENLSTAEAIFDALGYPEDSKVDGLGYDLELEFVDGKVARGIIIKTTENDDITFNINNVVERDKIDIDMIINGDCEVKVKDIQSKLAQLGIPLNVTDWGNAKVSSSKPYLSKKDAQRKGSLI